MKGVRLIPLGGGQERKPAQPSAAPEDAAQPTPITQPAAPTAAPPAAAPAGEAVAPLMEARGLERAYTVGSERVAALRGLDLALWPGRVAVLRGRSGAGKTTLLNLIAGLDEPTAGTALLFGSDLAKLSEEQRTRLRREGLGFVFQSAHLFPILTALENVELPLRLAHAEQRERRQRAAEALELVGLAGRARHRALELSGG